MIFSFFQFQRSVLALFVQGVSVQGVYAQGVGVLGVYVQGGKCPGGKCPRGYMSGGGVMPSTHLDRQCNVCTLDST